MIAEKLERLWIFDFDGTLSPLVPDRDRAELHPACTGLLKELAALPRQRVAILSSRLLADLIPRVPVPGLFLGGGSGMEWQVPDGPRVIFGDRHKLNEAHNALLPVLQKIASLPGIELEDKKWSIAIHLRNASKEDKRELCTRIEKWQQAESVPVFPGPEVFEVQFLQGVDKTYGVRSLCLMLKFDPAVGGIVYAGDDANDARAMRWVDSLGGITVTVGDSPLIPGSLVAGDQIALVHEIRGILGLACSRKKGKYARG